MLDIKKLGRPIIFTLQFTITLQLRDANMTHGSEMQLPPGKLREGGGQMWEINVCGGVFPICALWREISNLVIKLSVCLR